MPQAAVPQWLGRYPIVDADHVHDLDTRAALKEFHDKLPRHEAEAAAHADYVRDQLVEAAVHHLTGLQAAHAAGDHDAAKRHGVMYGLCVKRIDPKANIAGEPPPEVATRAKNAPAQVYRFRAHAGDAFALPEKSEKPSSSE